MVYEKNIPQNNVIKERFEFKLMINDNIICQRYFRINNFNEESKGSLELRDTIERCVELIDNDLKSKSRVYMWHVAPMVFSNEDEMRNWLSNPYNSSKLRVGEGLVIRGTNTEFYWDGEKVCESEKNIVNKDFYNVIDDTTPFTFKFSFLDNDVEVCSRIWDGSYYPRIVRNGVDLSNKKGKFNKSDLSGLNFENYTLYHMVNGKTDLVYTIIKEICETCSSLVGEKRRYTTTETYGNFPNQGEDKKYNFLVNSNWNKYVAQVEKQYKKKTDEYFKNLYR